MRLRQLLVGIVAIIPAALRPPPAAGCQAQHREMLRAKFQRALQRVADQYDGVLGVATIDLADTGAASIVGVNQDLVFPTGSAIKVPILIELFRRGAGDPALLRSRHPITAATRTGGSGVLQFFTDGGSELSTEDLAILMITLSDNGATNMLIDVVGLEPVNRMLAGLGLRETKLRRKMIRPDAMLRGDENVSTPAEAASLMARIARCQLPLSPSSCARVRQILELPKDEPVRSVVPGSIPVASKPGDLTGVAASWALVELPGRPFVLTVMTNYGDGDRGHAAIREIAGLALEYYGKLAGVTPNGARLPVR